MVAKQNQPDGRSNTNNKAASKFSKHAQSDAAIAPTAGDSEVQQRKGLSWGGRFTVFFLFPLVVGCISLLVGLIEKRRNPDHELNVDRDFMYPFMLALCLTLVIGFQTRGFAKDKPDSLVAWPKVKKQRKVVHKHVVKGKAGESDKKNA